MHIKQYTVYAKLIEVVFNILVYADLTYGDGSHNIVWLPDATVGYFSGKHTVLFIVAVVITLVGLVYTLLVCSLVFVDHLRIFHRGRSRIHCQAKSRSVYTKPTSVITTATVNKTVCLPLK